MENISRGIRVRLAEIRRAHFGRRGKSRFARELGIQPSTYNHYETDRTAPVELLVLAARITRTSLQWLLTGQGAMPAELPPLGDTEVDRIVNRFRQLLSSKPGLKRSAAEFVALMEQMAGSGETAVASRPISLSIGELVPVVGGTAAGPARFWSEYGASVEGRHADSRLEQLLDQQSERKVSAAELHAAAPEIVSESTVSLIQLSRPDSWGIIEFLSCQAVKSKYPKAVAWRIDGDSMAPRYVDGDFVITAADQLAVEGHPCVARQREQIGVNCKIFHHDGRRITLIPVNESSAAQTFDEADLLWAYRVLFSVRLSPRR